MFSKQSSAQPCSPSLTYPDHYLQVLAKHPGTLCTLFLEGVTIEAPWLLHLEYAWREDLSHAQADVVDTRLRAYIACAIFDACQTAKIRCKSGPPHGSRPSWFLEDLPVPYSLVQASFSTEDKRMYQTVGPTMMAPAIFELENAQIIGLVQGFSIKFRTLKV